MTFKIENGATFNSDILANFEIERVTHDLNRHDVVVVTSDGYWRASFGAMHAALHFAQQGDFILSSNGTVVQVTQPMRRY